MVCGCADVPEVRCRRSHTARAMAQGPPDVFFTCSVPNQPASLFCFVLFTRRMLFASLRSPIPLRLPIRFPWSARLFARLHSINIPNPTAALQPSPSPPSPTAAVETEPDEYLRLIFDDSQIWHFHCHPPHSVLNPLFQPALNNPSVRRSPDRPAFTGLFNNSDLGATRGFQRAADKALRRARLIVERICRAPQNGDAEMRKVVKNLDRLSDTLCSVIDMAEFIRNAHPDQDVMEESNRAFEELCSYMNSLNTDKRMHEVRDINCILWRD